MNSGFLTASLTPPRARARERGGEACTGTDSSDRRNYMTTFRQRRLE
jgi:hypothetical protein